MAVDMSSADTTKRVPAWKRIGLKLKYAKDTADDSAVAERPRSVETGSDDAPPQESKKRAAGNVTDDQRRKRKRSRTSPDRSAPNSHAQSSLGLGISGHEGGISHASPQASSRIIFGGSINTPDGKICENSRRKSVTFTPDTKQEDGFSAARIFKSYVPPGQGTAAASQNVQQQSNELQPDESSETSLPSKPQTKEKAKKKKKKNSEKSIKTVQANSENSAAKGSSNRREDPAYLQYLRQYHEDKDHWKFNTTKQKLLLKNVWNLYRIPPEHNAALVEYIKGLQSPNSRKKLAQEAQDFLKTWYESDPANTKEVAMESFEARKATYEAALQRRLEQHAALGGRLSEYDEQQIEEIRCENERARRCQEICYQALMQEMHPELMPGMGQSSATSSTPASVSATSSAPAGQKRKRKARTEVSSDESSSSSSSSSESDSTSDSSSESDTDSDSESGGAARPSKKQADVFSKELLDSVFGKGKTPSWKVKPEPSVRSPKVDTEGDTSSDDGESEDASSSSAEGSEGASSDSESA